MPFNIDMNRFKQVTGTAAPASVGKPMTYEERLLGDLPARIAKATELINTGLDPEGGRRELDFVDGWARDPKNAQALATILQDKAQDPRTTALKASAFRVYSRSGFDVLRAKADIIGGQKTFAVSILQDIPAARRKAEALLTSGDIENGKAALEEVRGLVKRNSDMGEMLFSYTGDNPLLKKAQGIMLDTDWESRVAPLMDPATNPRSVDFLVRRGDVGLNMGAVMKDSLYGDPAQKRAARAALSVFGQEPVKQGRQAQQPGEEAAPAVVDAEGGFKYFRDASALGADAVDFGDLRVAGSVKRLFTAGDADNNGAGMTFALDAARKARQARGTDDPSLDRDVFTNAAEVYASALDGAQTAAKKREAGDAFLTLTKGLKPGEEATAGRKAATAVSSAFRILDGYTELGFNAGTRAKALAGVIYKTEQGRQADFTPEEAAVNTTMSTVRALKTGVKERLRTVPEAGQGGQPADGGLYVGFDRFNSGFTQMLNAVAGEALENGETLDAGAFKRKMTDPDGVGVRQITGLIRSLDPQADEGAAKSAAMLLADVFASTGQIDAAKLGSYVQAAKQAAGRATAGRAAAAADGAGPGDVVARQDMKTLSEKALSSANPDSPDYKFFKATEDLDLRDSAWYSLSSWDFAAGGKGANALREKLRDSWTGAPIAETFTGNPDVDTFLKGTKASDLADERTRKTVINWRVAEMIMDALSKKSVVLASAMSDPKIKARVADVANMYADTYTTRVRDELRGARSGTIGDVIPDTVLKSVAPSSVSGSPMSKAGKAAVVAATLPTMGMLAPVLAPGAYSEGLSNTLAAGDRFFGMESQDNPIRIEDRLASALLPLGAETDAARSLLARISQGVATGFEKPADVGDEEQVSATVVMAGKSQAEAEAVAGVLKRVSDRVQKPLTDRKILALGDRILRDGSDKNLGLGMDQAEDLRTVFFNQVEDYNGDPTVPWLNYQEKKAKAREEYSKALAAAQENAIELAARKAAAVSAAKGEVADNLN